MKKMHLEGTDIDGLTGMHRTEIGFLCQPVLRQLHFQHSLRQRRGVDGRLHLRQQVGQRTRVILVTVGDDNAAHLAAVLNQVGEIRDDIVHAQHVIFGEHQTAIHDEDVLAVFIDHAVPSNFPQTTQGGNF